jgi:hypothetical protein
MVFLISYLEGDTRVVLELDLGKVKKITNDEIRSADYRDTASLELQTLT